MTAVARLFGHPVAHSVSPAIHNAAFAALGIDARYEAVDVAPADLAAAVAELRAGPLLGANLTIPHKLAVLDLVDERTDETRLIGAANTLFWRDGGLVADNTDARGLQRAIQSAITCPGTAVILGSGGAARAAAVAMARLDMSVAVIARRPTAAESVAETAAAVGAEAVGLPLEYAANVLAHAAVVINATPLGLHGEALPDEFMHLQEQQLALDLVYGPQATPFLQAAQAAGATAIDGLGMLVQQAALAFTHWTQRDAPVPEMAAAAQMAITQRSDTSQ